MPAAMKIFHKLLLVMIPLLLITSAFIGGMVMMQLRATHSQAQALSQRVADVTDSANHVMQSVSQSMEDKAKSHYRFLAQQLAGVVDVGALDLDRVARQVATSPLCEVFVSAPDSARSLPARQLTRNLGELIKLYNLSEIVICDANGKELLRRAMERVPPGGIHLLTVKNSPI